MPHTPPTILRVAVPVPLRRQFDYLPPADSQAPWQPGVRVRVNFGNREMVGLLMATDQHSELSPDKLRPAIAIIDDTPLLPPSLLTLLNWAAHYYHHPLGEVFMSAFPVLLRSRDEGDSSKGWQATESGRAIPLETLKRAPQQMRALELLLAQPAPLDSQQLKAAEIPSEALRALQRKGLAEQLNLSASPVLPLATAHPEPALALSAEQTRALQTICEGDGFHCTLLEGITGSGKTEVYLQFIAKVLASGRQAMVLIPEIGLTPQTVERFRRRFAVPIAVMHSNLSERERWQAWEATRTGQARILIGTRSALFTPMAQPGGIIVDEEHDASFKQQEGFRYSARDVAVKRGQLEQIPVLLGSATPALETLHNALTGRYRHARLLQRAGNARPPLMRVVDLRAQPLNEGLSAELLAALQAHLQRGHQALVFLNRRGFAPTLLCRDCGWLADCQHCDARLTAHFGSRRLTCHHCGASQAWPRSCPSCHSAQLIPLGQGTERSELALAELFPSVPVIRIDSDTTTRKDALAERLQAVNRGEPCILVGTQMLAKGHHFPAVTLVGILDADAGLFSPDFRGPERLGQLLTQVAGRAGRGELAGEVVVQSWHPEHPLLEMLLQEGYPHYARELLQERQRLGLPPFGQLALFRAEAGTQVAAEELLFRLRKAAERLSPGGISLLGPLPAAMPKRAGRYRAQLLLRAGSRAQLHTLLQMLCRELESWRLGGNRRWSLEVDPLET